MHRVASLEKRVSSPFVRDGTGCFAAPFQSHRAGFFPSSRNR